MSEEKRPEWMSSISGIVNPNDYLSGRKIDKTFELSQQEKAQQRKEILTNLIKTDRIKLTGDPLLDLERRKYQLKLDIISNPIRLRQFRERLLRDEREKQNRDSSSTNNAIKYRDEQNVTKLNQHSSTSRSHRDRSISSEKRRDRSRSRDKRRSRSRSRDRRKSRSRSRERGRSRSRSRDRDRGGERRRERSKSRERRRDRSRSRERRRDRSRSRERRRSRSGSKGRYRRRSERY